MEKQTITTTNLKQGDKFQYIGAADDDWHIVEKVDGTHFHYSAGQYPQKAYRTDVVQVYIEVKQEQTV